MLDRAVDSLVLRGKQYEPLTPYANGWLCSQDFPGLSRSAAALMHGDMRRVLAVIQEGIASPAHAAFVERLREAGGA